MNSHLQRIRRHRNRLRQLPPGAACATGDESHPRALIVGAVPPTCLACRKTADGASPWEDHHPLGKKVDRQFTIPTPNNLHGVLSDMQLDHQPITNRQNPLELLRELVLFGINSLRASADWLEHRLGDLNDLIAYAAERLGADWP